MVEEPPWIAGSVLRRTHAVLARRPVFKSLLAVVVRGLDARSPTDAALVALCPGARVAAAAYYAGEGPQLRDALGSEDLRLLDAWLSSEIRRWALRWQSLDPVRQGSAPSTGAALGMLVTELAARRVPDAVAGLVERLIDRACPTGR